MTVAAPVQARPPAAHSSPNKWSMAAVLRLYAAAGQRFEADLAHYVNGTGGYVIARPDLLLLFRPVVRADLGTWLAAAGTADAWYVRLLAGPGSLRAAIHEMPYFLPWCCWHRNFRRPGGPVRLARTETIINKLRK